MHLPEDIAANGSFANAHDNGKASQGDEALRTLRARIANLSMPSHKFCTIIAE